MLIRSNRARAGSDRYVMLSPQLLVVLRAPTGGGALAISGAGTSRPARRERVCSGIRKRGWRQGWASRVTTSHTLRHSFATICSKPAPTSASSRACPAQAGVLLGHRDLSTTVRYTQVAATTIRQHPSARSTGSKAGGEAEPA